MKPEQKKCVNEECQNILPDGYRHKYCAECRAARAEKRNRTITDLLCAPGIVAMKIATRGNDRYQKKD